MILGTDATLYPKAGCLRVGRALYNIRGIYNSAGKHLWELLIHNPVGISKRTIFIDHSFTMYSMIIRLDATGTGMAFVFEPFIRGKWMPLTCVGIIQRPMRRFLLLRKRQQLEHRALAVMMATHPRLGKESPLGQEISEDVLCKQIVLAFLMK